jgi:DNA repair exonuclease SbcCD ATPase subunit
MTLTPTLNDDAIRETFRAWNVERDSLDSQLTESLAAISAYQSHLDTWQKQLARERDELRTAREQVERDRANADKGHAEASATMVNELNAAREKITALTTLLLNRTEELRALDNRRAEVQTELELARTRERELNAALEEQRSATEQERSQWSEELRQLRGVLERQLDSPAVEQPVSAVQQPAAPAAAPAEPSAPPVQRPSSAGGGARVLPRESAVLGSIVEQFGKLRQQRAVERQSHRPR